MSCKQEEGIFVGSDGDVNVVGLREPGSGEYISDATVTFGLHLTDAAAVSIADPAPISGTGGTATYIADSNGCYRGSIADNQTGLLAIGQTYFVGIKIVTQDGKTKRVSLPYVAKIARG